MFMSVKDIAQLVASLTADPGVANSIQAQSNFLKTKQHVLN